MVNKILTHSKYGAVKVDHRFNFGADDIDFLNKTEFNLLKRINIAITSNLIAGFGDEYEDKFQSHYDELYIEKILNGEEPAFFPLSIFYRFHKRLLKFMRGVTRARYRGKSKIEKREAGFCTVENATTFNIYRKYI